jgi:GT2 family glycosyltransferase
MRRRDCSGDSQKDKAMPEEQRTATRSEPVSVVMPCCGQLEYTRLSVPRLLRHTRQPFEVLFVDAGSLDGTADYLAGVADASIVPVKIFRGARNAEFPQLVLQALAEASGRLVAWVNNDVLLPQLWLQQLLALAAAHEAIGLVGPMSNVAPAPQRVTPIPYRLGRPRREILIQNGRNAGLDTQAVDHFAQEYREANHGQWAEMEQIGGFCWLVKKEVLGKVQLLEEEAEEAVLDARRFSGRVRRAGYRLGCCRDLYVHHFGSNLM